MAVKVKSREILQMVTAYPLGKSVFDLQKEMGLASIINLSEIENVFGCSPFVKNHLTHQLDHLFTYPDGSARLLSAKLAEFLNVKSDRLFIGNGSDEIIRLLLRAFLNAGDEAVMAEITFPRYKTNVTIEGGRPVLVPLIDGTHDLDGMLASITEKTKLIFVCNPNNPTGTIVEKKKLEDFISKVPEHILVVLDEAYYEYAVNDEYLQSVPYLKKYSNLVILRTFSKVYGLAGLRIGYGLMDPFIAEELNKVKEVFNVNQLAQAAAISALDDQEFRVECVERNEEGKQFLGNELTKMGYTFFPTHANFMMIHTGQPGDVVRNELLKNGILVKSGSALGYPDAIRVTISSMQDNHYFIKCLKNIESGNGGIS
ncbi:histidinol-phosphate transaminase [Bacillus tianshenii]|uniref:histidinol-phosphate transaminase n=1 Tax=Sutcliffiella tianshenii TaxID=1463404 RepID=UPI001CD26CAD|nr:histidinol-phosphate transaminase [Bacillus tianshenii]MCA1319551.1 histidinol-phosphate transaminase [Bacillus tianshenii]